MKTSQWSGNGLFSAFGEYGLSGVDGRPMRAGSASIDLRLGTWFVSLRHTRLPALHIDENPSAAANNAKLSKSHFVPFGTEKPSHFSFETLFLD